MCRAQTELCLEHGAQLQVAIKTAVSTTPAGRNQDVMFSPVSYAPVCGTPKHLELKNSGKIIYTFGNSNLVKEASWCAKKNVKITITNIITYKNEPLSNNSKYMFDNLLEKLNVVGDLIFERGKRICKTHFGENSIDYELQHPNIQNHHPFKTIGIIFCEHEGVLDKNSTMLIGSDDTQLRMVHLNFMKSKPFGIFPGQTVIVSGTNPRGDDLIVEEIFTERILELPDPPKIDEPLNFVFAVGPYTHADDLIYNPLSELITYCKESKPHVLMLIGPFVDSEHCMVNGNFIAETYESYFLKIVTKIVEEIGSDITICFIASNTDVNADLVYPTPPIELSKKFANVHMLPDPCIVDVNGIEIGLTATDIFEHILKNELILNATDKVKRIANYLFEEGSFYPLSPPVDGICFDSKLASRYAKIEKVPHVFILPSTEKVFIRDTNRCLTINPGQLANSKGGTFARLIIYPEKENKNGLLDYMACQIMKV